MNLMQRVLTLFALFCFLGVASSSSLAADEPKATEGSAEAKKEPKDLVLKGDAVCTSCHDDTEIYPVLAIGKTKHGVMADKNAPTCTTCHGESKNHLNIPKGEKDRPKPERLFGMRPSIPAELQVERYFGLFGKNTATPVAERNAPCLECHQGDERIHWVGSAHQAGDVACTSCHQIHTTHDRARDKHAQTEMCFACHKEQRAQLSRPSRHPIKEGKVACSDCHNPHGTAGPKLLVRDNVNDTCYQCHMEKRGPFVRSHQPVQEDCSICHNPHGTTNPNLLKVRAPFLCQSCHEPTSHHSEVPLGGLVGGGNPGTGQRVIMARGCLNCHTNIHGSNNPADGSGRGFRR